MGKYAILSILTILSWLGSFAQSPNYQLLYRTRISWLQITNTVPVSSWDSIYVKGPNGWMGTAPRTVWDNLPGKPAAYPSTIALIPTLQTTLDAKANQSALAGYQPVGNYLTSETDPVWTAVASNYRTKIQNDALYQPIGNYLIAETDPVWTTEKAAYRTKLQNDALYQAAGTYISSESDPVWVSASVNYRTKVQNDALYRPITYVPDTLVYRTVSNSLTLSQLQARFNSKENTLPVGSSAQYMRGDKVWATLDKNAVGLANVDNTSDANKPISTAVQTALSTKQGNIVLTTTGTGAATLTGSTLNIPTPITGIKVFISTVTVGQSRAQLNTTYPTAGVGDMVLAPSILLGGAVYIKNGTSGGGTWQTISAPPTL